MLKRAEEVLKQLEERREKDDNKAKITKREEGYQLSFITLDDPLLLDIKEEIIDLDINSLTPVEALMKLNDIKNMLQKKGRK